MNKINAPANMIPPLCPTLFKVVDPSSNESLFFEKEELAQDWLATHSNWILKKRELISWTFPLEKTISEPCWVKIR